MGIIQEVVEPTDWVAFVLPVLKKNDQTRVCIDFSELNKSVRRKRSKFLRQRLFFVRYKEISVLNLCMLNQDLRRFLLNRSSLLLTKFITPFRRFRCLRLQFGITSGPQIFRE